MADEETPDQVEIEHIRRLGGDLGPVFHAVWNDHAALCVTWQEYREAFGTSPERVELLNSAAGFFFRIVQDTFWEHILLHLCRLTDPVKSVGRPPRPNLTLAVLPQLIDDLALRAEVTALADQAIAATAFARDWRNRHISHRDLALALNSGARPLASASRKQVSDALSAIHAVLNKISERLLESTAATDVIPPPTGAVTLLLLLRQGLEARDARRERLRRGEPLPGDVGPRAV